MSETTYSKKVYDIDLNEVVPALEKIVHSQTLSPNLKISKEEYLRQIKIAADDLKQLLGYRNEPYFIVRQPQETFDWWFAIFLSIHKPHQIALILDYHFTKAMDQEGFVNQVEFLVLKHMGHIIYHDVESQLMEISKWVREKRKEYPVARIEGENGSKNVNSPPSTLIESPFDQYLLEGLTPFCEKDSIKNLKTLISGSAIDRPVILKSNFKKRSLIRPIQELVRRCQMNMNQKEASEWMVDNFAIRKGLALNQFSRAGTLKVMSQYDSEPKRAQLKYMHWFKSDSV